MMVAKWGIRIYAGLVVLCLAWPGVAQLPVTSFRKIDLRDGLPEFAMPHDLLQDTLGRVWIAYESGLFHFDGYTVSSVPVSVQDSLALPEQAVNMLCKDRQGRIWIGLRNMGLCIVEVTTGKWTRILPERHGGLLPAERIWDMLQLSEHTYYIATETGLVHFDELTGKFHRFNFNDPSSGEKETAYTNTMRTIHRDFQDTSLYWIGTRCGLVSFDSRNKEFRKYEMPYYSSEIGLLPLNYMIMKIIMPNPNEIWCSTWGSGIIHFNTDSGQWSRYRNQVEIKYDDIGYEFNLKDNDECWYGTRNKAGIFNLNSRTYEYFSSDANSEHYLPWSYHYGRMLTLADGHLMVLGSNGLYISEDPVTTGHEKAVRPFLTTLASHTQQIVLNKPAAFSDTLHLHVPDASFHAQAVLTEFARPEEVQYRFKLNGYDDEWIEQSNARNIQFTNLPAGTYSLMVEAKQPGEEWISIRKPVIVHVKMPLYRNPVLWVLAGIFLISLLGYGFWFRWKHLRREMRMKSEFSQKLAQNEMKALRAQMNPHFMFNSLNSIKNFILRQETKEASHYLTRFSQLMRMILRNSSQPLIPFTDELEALRLYIELELMRFDGGFEVEFEVDESIDQQNLLIPPMLIQPYVENAIWHGLMHKSAPRVLAIRAQRDLQNLIIHIVDNGIGREQAAKMNSRNRNNHKSYGMQITRDRLNLIEQSLAIRTCVDIHDRFDAHGQPAGTEVKITIPVLTQFDQGHPQNQLETNEQVKYDHN